VSLRYNQWKIVFQEQRAQGIKVWVELFTTLRRPKIFNLRTNPFEVATMFLQIMTIGGSPDCT
jgi:hypothetical protein